MKGIRVNQRELVDTFIFIRCFGELGSNTDWYSTLLGCPIINAAQVGASLTWKAKIHRNCLYYAIKSSCDTHVVKVWKTNSPSRDLTSVNSANSVLTTPLSSSSLHKTISIVTWNCRGNSSHYLQDLISKGVDIIIVQEHWLWTFELGSFNNLHPNFAFSAISDK